MHLKLSFYTNTYLVVNITKVTSHKMRGLMNKSGQNVSLVNSVEYASVFQILIVWYGQSENAHLKNSACLNQHVNVTLHGFLPENKHTENFSISTK
jgi:hypothetical protein